MYLYWLKEKKIMKLPRNWKSHLEIITNQHSKKEIEYVLQLSLPKKPTPINVGYIYITKDDGFNFVKVVSVIPQLRGKGCGSMLYEYAIEQLGSLSTHYHDASSLAQKVWRRLIQKYDYTGDFFAGVLTVFKKPVDKRRKRR